MYPITNFRNKAPMFSKEYLDNYRVNFKLAYPIMLGQAGHMVAGIADSIMVGQLGTNELAAVSLANSVFILVFIIGIGFANALTPLVGMAFGQKDFLKSGDIFKNGIIANLSIGIILTILALLLRFIMPYINQPPIVVKLALPYYDVVCAGLMPYMLFLTGKQFLEGISDTKPGMIISLLCNIQNIIFNYFLIFGVWLFPKWGLFGAGLSTSIARVTMAALICLHIVLHPKYSIFFRAKKHKIFSADVIRKIFKMGIPISVQHSTETWTFAIGGIMAGWFGVTALAAHQIALSLASLSFMAATGLATAATIRLSNTLGEKKEHLLIRTGLSAYIMVIAFMSIMALSFIFFGKELASIYVKDINVINLTGILLIITGLFQIFDGSQALGLGALRGLHDVKFPAIITFASYWVILLPSAYILSVILKWGVVGIWLGFMLGLMFAAFALFARFKFICKILNKPTKTIAKL
jgi:multidrug resistance protein, MATE family